MQSCIMISVIGGGASAAPSPEPRAEAATREGLIPSAGRCSWTARRLRTCRLPALRLQVLVQQQQGATRSEVMLLVIRCVVGGKVVDQHGLVFGGRSKSRSSHASLTPPRHCSRHKMSWLPFESTAGF